MIYFWFVVGAAIGSFLNVCIHRLPRGESIVFPASHCVNCGHKLSAWDLIPVLGYLWLKGRCRYCGTGISFRYPLVEMLSAILLTLAWTNSGGNTFYYIFQSVFISMLLVIFFTDLENQVVPDAVTLPGIIIGLLYGFFSRNIFSSLAGMVLGYLLLYFIGRAGKFIFKKDALGEGDPCVAALLGAFLGWEKLLLALFLAYLLAAFISAALLIAGKVKIGQAVPFAPALAAGGAIALFCGGRMLIWYSGWLI
jgi:leader peptidase (prepilin peptidase)/N-methyltransferase